MISVLICEDHLFSIVTEKLVKRPLLPLTLSDRHNRIDRGDVNYFRASRPKLNLCSGRGVYFSFGISHSIILCAIATLIRRSVKGRHAAAANQEPTAHATSPRQDATDRPDDVPASGLGFLRR